MTLSEPLILYPPLMTMTFICVFVTTVLVVGRLNEHPPYVLLLDVFPGLAAIFGLMLLIVSGHAWTAAIPLVLGLVEGVLVGLRWYAPGFLVDRS